ncbi:family 16 glycosylhydrolase [Candidatus Methanoperedens sp. BLZ2]|nr:glycoside hydrolase family 16 protein [Candidatus Methanoperedens sp. BLZ2]KAB2947786.1 MAG: glycoside hydrolase family 16 protein [Candidatus Methanoperedens sp.]
MKTTSNSKINIMNSLSHKSVLIHICDIFMLIFIIFPIIIVIQISISPSSQDPSGYTLVWNDDFNDKTLDTSKWSKENRHPQSLNNELEIYIPDEVYIEDGTLILRSEKKNYQGYNYTSGSVISRDKFFQKYGWFEIRAKLPEGKGIWPAFWLVPNDRLWPPEIDVFELLGHDTRKIYMTNHWECENPSKATLSCFNQEDYMISDLNVPDFSSDYHTFAIEWQPGLIRWIIDGKERFRSTLYVPDIPMYLYLNTAVGGNWPGDPDSTVVFPQYYYIDYVRVYNKI